MELKAQILSPAITLCMAVVTWCQTIDFDHCLSAGFTKDLTCRSCKDLPRYRLDFLVEDCNSCCAAEDELPQKPNNVIILYFCSPTHLLNLVYVNENWVGIRKLKPKQFPGLEIRYVRGADPTVKLMNENRETVEVLGVDKWNTDSIEEFFKERLSS
ncbi:hypothetical protein HELRODRAFT_163279 [Helobdella robusta]|uniref:Selenoprotein F n=1 Tax=Helobdella robusta TaxID=6412 RepID=T1ETV2_HELRO|nr:hypothetical protein HELRODRAFT_163279 [Helobdella robusta]ESN96235.1 hypothetical protein HELRODRAFT_163279 [Helobdella robusta]